MLSAHIWNISGRYNQALNITVNIPESAIILPLKSIFLKWQVVSKFEEKHSLYFVSQKVYSKMDTLVIIVEA